MTATSIDTGSTASLAMRLTRGILWSALVGVAALGVLLAAALLTQGAVVSPRDPAQGSGLTGIGLPGPTGLADARRTWADRTLAAPEVHPGLPRPTLVDVIPVVPDNVRVTMLERPKTGRR